MKISGEKIGRLMYLLKNHKELTIPQPLLRYIPGADWLIPVIYDGVGASDVDPALVSQLIDIGERHGPGTPKEGSILIQKLVDESLRTETRLTTEQRLSIYRMLDGLQFTSTDQTVEIDLNDPGEITPIPKFETGFQPLDSVLGGLYQGIFMLLGPPGSGKTSLMISIIETLRKNDWSGSLFMLENEIPAPMMKGRFADVFQRTKFKEGDKLICGPWSAKHILNWVQEHPDPERIILFDSPDVMIGSQNVFSKKLFQEAEYLTLIALKSLCRAVIVSSWPNRKSNTVEHFNDVSDAIEKARYADAIIGINPQANGRLQFRGLKNRFGPNDMEIIFTYDYESLVWEAGSIEIEADFWEALQQESNEDEAIEAEAHAQSNGRA